MSAANHDLILWLDEPAMWSGVLNENKGVRAPHLTECNKEVMFALSWRNRLSKGD
jgi:hypothetical protein